MAARMTRNEAWGYAEFPLTASQVAEKGKMACIDTSTGLLAIGSGSATLRPIGYFDVDSQVTGDGVTPVRVRLFDEIRIHWWDNDTGGTPVTAADVGGLCYILDDVTVSGAVAGSVAGRVWALNTTYGVAVEMIGFDAAES